MTSTWMNKDYLHLCRFWLDEDEVVGFVFYENPVTNLHFVLHPGYEELADEMIAYAIEVFPDINNEKEFVFSEAQTALMEAAEKRGYKLCHKEREYRLDITTSALNYEHNIIIANENEEYVCFSGMWWVPENKLAYMEPLCTIPEYQHQGLASAALTKHYQRLKEMGGRILTGGGNDFYKRIGYDTEVYSLIYKKI